LEAVLATGAEHVHVTHGFSEILSRYLRETHQLNADVVEKGMLEMQGQ
jgi:hypothetical protein